MKSKAVEERSAIISDSFLRSYSLSRIVRLNEENRNKAKVIIMKKCTFSFIKCGVSKKINIKIWTHPLNRMTPSKIVRQKHRLKS
jgi:hypothetical protein